MSEIRDNKQIKNLRFADYFIFSLLFGLLALGILFFSSANIHHDSGDYYTILQKLTDSSKKPVIPNTHFVEQRSPGYGIISAIPYYFASVAIEPFVKTQEIIDKGQMPPGWLGGSQRPKNSGEENINRAPPGGGGIPSESLSVKDIFFKNFYIKALDAWFEWKIIFAMLLTSYVFLFMGIIFSVKTLMLKRKKRKDLLLPILTIATSVIFLASIIIIPTYATLTAFGLSSLFCYFYIKSFEKDNTTIQLLTGIFLGLLVLTRLETVLIAGVLGLFLIFYRKWNLLKNIVLGSLPSLVIILIYNYSQFGNPLHFGILNGDINQLGFDPGYIYANLIGLKSGILFYSFFTTIGLMGLFLSKEKHLKMLGVASLTVIVLLLVRVPIMYKCIGGDPVDLGGILVDCARNKDEALMLVRSDANRYIIVLVPFAVLGLQNLFIIFGKYFKNKFATKEKIDKIKI